MNAFIESQPDVNNFKFYCFAFLAIFLMSWIIPLN